MYGIDFWKRASIRHVCEFIRNGGELCYEIEGTPEEQYARHENDMTIGLRKFRDKAATFDWNSLGDDEREKDRATDEMCDEMLEAFDKLHDLAFEMGFTAGSKMWQSIDRTAQSEESDMK